MRLFILALLPCLFSIVAAAKDDPKSYTAQSITVGHMAGTGQRLIGQQYTFPYGVFEIQPDTLDNLILVLRSIKNGHYGNKGSLMSINIQSGVVNWDKDIRRFHIRFSKDLMLYNTEESTKVMNKHTGDFVCGTTYDVKYIDYDHNKGLTYGGTFLDLQNCKVLWQEKMDLAYGVAQLEQPSDSTILIASNGIHMVNLRTGDGWHYNMSTGRENNTNAIIAGVAGGLLLGAVGGGIAGATATDYISGLSSNMIVDSAANRIYYSALKSTVALTLDGKEVWKSQLAKRETSKSYLFDEGDRLVHLNSGIAFVNGQLAAEGVPFIAAYDKKSGDTLFNRLLGATGAVTSFYTIGDKTLLKVGSDLLLYKQATGTLLSDRTLDKKEDRKNPLWVAGGETYFVRDADSTFHSLHDKNAGNFTVFDTGAFYRVNADLTTTKLWDTEEVWTGNLKYKDLIFVYNKEYLAIIKGNKPVAYISQKGSHTVRSGKLYIINENTLTIIPLEELP